MKKYKLVQFSDGTYGVKHWFFNRFLDLELPQYTRRPGDSCFVDCKGTYQKAKKILDSKNTKWKVVKEQP